MKTVRYLKVEYKPKQHSCGIKENAQKCTINQPNVGQPEISEKVSKS
jgi:hypothetical protein